MSRFDLATFAKLAAPLRLRRPVVTFATNSIKLRFAPDSGRAGRYIWIDPPWQLQRNDQPFLDSSSYPDPRSVSGRRRERTWLKSAGRFRPGSFLSLSREKAQLARFRFLNGWSIFVPVSASQRDEEQWYDDWYVGDTQVPPNTSLERSRGA